MAKIVVKYKIPTAGSVKIIIILKNREFLSKEKLNMLDLESWSKITLGELK
jgi:CRISPR/Cas system-associated protein endoribonuclease Cas2